MSKGVWEGVGDEILTALTGEAELTPIEVGELDLLGPEAIPLLLEQQRMENFLSNDVERILKRIQRNREREEREEEFKRASQEGAIRIRGPMPSPEGQREIMERIAEKIRRQRGKAGEQIPAEERKFRADDPEGMRERRPHREETGLEDVELGEIKVEPVRSPPPRSEPDEPIIPTPLKVGAGVGTGVAGLVGVGRTLLGEGGAGLGTGQIPSVSETIKKTPAPTPAPAPTPTPSPTIPTGVFIRPKRIKELNSLMRPSGGRTIIRFEGEYRTPRRTHNNVELVRRANALNAYADNIFNTSFGGKIQAPSGGQTLLK